MQLLLIRHGQANFAACDTRGMVGPARDLAPLSDVGRRQADKLAAGLDVSGVDMILSSPYTRALETAAALCRHTGLPLRVEVDLREWQPDTTCSGVQPSQALYADFCRCRGIPPDGRTPAWESIPAMNARVQRVFDAYLAQGYQRLIAVTHGGVIRRLTGLSRVAHCQPYAVDYREGFAFFGWVEGSNRA